MLPVYIEAKGDDCASAWLERDDQRIPLRRVFDDVDPILLSGAPTTGAEAEAARQLAERLEDVRLAAAILAGAAEKAEAAIDATRYIRFVPLTAQRTWVRPLIAAREPLRRIIETCAAFEDALADDGSGPRPTRNSAIAQTDGPRVLTSLELADLDHVGLGDGAAA